MISRFVGWLISRTIELWDDWRDPDWKAEFDPHEDRIRNPTPRQIEKMRASGAIKIDDVGPC
jgi:hypothetical protein